MRLSPGLRALLAAAPERMLWGSDRPHTVTGPGSVDDPAAVYGFD